MQMIHCVQPYKDNMSEQLDPLCFKGQMAFAVTNRGELIPCCRCDEPDTINDPEFQELLKVSKISDHNSVKDILSTKPWKRFYKNLKRNIGPKACWRTCKLNKSKAKTQTLKVIDPETNRVKVTQQR